VNRSTLAVNNDDAVKKVTSGLEQFSDSPTYLEFAESLGGSEYLNRFRPPFKLIGLPEQEDE
jgi:hypothetical protein